MNNAPKQINLFTKRTNTAKELHTPESEIQAAFVEFLQTNCYKVLIARSWTDGANCVIDYLGLPVKRF